MFRSIYSTAAVLAAGALLQGCATTSAGWGQPIEKSGIELTFVSATASQEIRLSPYRVTPTKDSFVRIEVAMLNKTKEPLRPGQQPLFQLVDEGGARYDVHSLHTLAVNAARGSSGVSGPINPNVKYAREIVFEVPRGKRYALEVTIPNPNRPMYTTTYASRHQVDVRVPLPAGSVFR